MRTVQGKCVHCTLHYEWYPRGEAPRRLSEARCVECKAPLTRTSYLLRYYRRILTVPLRAVKS